LQSIAEFLQGGPHFFGRGHWLLPQTCPPTQAKPPRFSLGEVDRRVTVYYFYLWDADFGQAFITVRTYCPWPIKVWVNDHEWAKRQAAREVSSGATAEQQRWSRVRLPLLERLPAIET
jgi:hypothetical protein